MFKFGDWKKVTYYYVFTISLFQTSTLSSLTGRHRLWPHRDEALKDAQSQHGQQHPKVHRMSTLENLSDFWDLKYGGILNTIMYHLYIYIYLFIYLYYSHIFGGNWGIFIRPYFTYIVVCTCIYLQFSFFENRIWFSKLSTILFAGVILAMHTGQQSTELCKKKQVKIDRWSGKCLHHCFCSTHT